MPSIMKDVCRLCAKQNSVCVDVFGEEGVKQNVDLRVRLCTPIIIKEEEDMPKQVCLGCLDKLDKSYEFYMDCVSAQNIIKKMLGKRQTRSSAAASSNASTTGSGNCGLSSSLLARLNEGEVSLSDFLADDGESPAKKPRQENASRLPELPAADPSQMEDIKPVPGVDVPDINTLLRNSTVNSLQQGTMPTIKARPESPVDDTPGPMVVINPSSVAAAAAVPIPSVAAPPSLPLCAPGPPPVAALTPTSASIPLSVPAPTTTVSYVVNGIDSSALCRDSTLPNSAVIVQSARENIYVSELSGVVTNPAMCAVTSAVREQNCEVLGNLTPQGVVHFEMRNGSPHQLAYANIIQSSGPSLSTQPGVYVQDINREYGSGEMYVVSQQSSTPATQTDPLMTSLQSVPSSVAYSRSNKSDPPRVVYSNRTAVSNSLTTPTKQVLPTVSLSSQPQQSLQINEQSVISHSSQGSNVSISHANSKRLVVVAASAPSVLPTSTTSPKILKITQPKNQVRMQPQGGLQHTLLNQQLQQQQHHTTNQVQTRVQLQQQLPLLKLPVGTSIAQSQQQIQKQSQQQIQKQPQQQLQKQPQQQIQKQPQQQMQKQPQQQMQKQPQQQMQKQPQQMLSPQQPVQLQQLQHQSSLLKQQLQTHPVVSQQASAVSVAPATTAATVKATSSTTPVSTPSRKKNEPDEVCEHCQKSFPPDILIHHRVLHFRERFFSCISCGKNFRTEVGLDQHRCDVD